MNDQSNGERAIGTLAEVLLDAASKGFKRRPRTGLGEFDLIGPDGRVAIYGFEPEMATTNLRSKARHVFIVVRDWPVSVPVRRDGRGVSGDRSGA